LSRQEIEPRADLLAASDGVAEIQGFITRPTLLSNVHPTSIVAQQEIFGPVLATMTFRTPPRCLWNWANNTASTGVARVCMDGREYQRRVANSSATEAGVVW